MATPEAGNDSSFYEFTYGLAYGLANVSKGILYSEWVFEQPFYT
jgi:hypothetical protein